MAAASVSGTRSDRERFVCRGVSTERRRRHDRERDAGAVAALSGTGAQQGRGGAAGRRQPADGASLDRGGKAGPGSGRGVGRVRTEAAPAFAARSLQGDHQGPPGSVSGSQRCAAVRGDPGGGLLGWLRPGEALRAREAAAAAVRAGAALRDPAGAPGAGGLRGVPHAVGQSGMRWSWCWATRG